MHHLYVRCADKTLVEIWTTMPLIKENLVELFGTGYELLPLPVTKAVPLELSPKRVGPRSESFKE